MSNEPKLDNSNEPDLVNGPENEKLQNFVSSYDIIMTVYDPKQDDKIIRCVRLDYGYKKHRGYMGRLSFWSWTMGYVVETNSAELK